MKNELRVQTKLTLVVRNIQEIIRDASSNALNMFMLELVPRK
jgi:hypothetical protein